MSPLSRLTAGPVAAAAVALTTIILATVNPGRALGAPGDEPEPTQITEVVMYGIDDDTHELLRYSFGASDYLAVGVVRNLYDASVVANIESLGYIPHGPHKGLYGVANNDDDDDDDGYYDDDDDDGDDHGSKLVKFDTFSAAVEVYPVATGFSKVMGMVAAIDPESGEWILYATQAGGGGDDDDDDDDDDDGDDDDDDDDDDESTTASLIAINPETGIGEMVMSLGMKFEGLARGSDGTLRAAHDAELWAIDPEAGTVTMIGDHGYGDVEALEYAIGDADPQIDIPGAPASWTAEGVLFAFSEDADTMLIINPATGEAVQYKCPVSETDFKGIVFLTQLSDPFGPVVAGPCD